MDDELRPKDAAEEVALFRAQVLGPVLCRGALDHGEMPEALRELSAQPVRPPGAARTRTYAVSTLERWYYANRDGGLIALRPRPPSDRGHAQALTDAQRKLLVAIREAHPRVSAALILRTLVTDGRIGISSTAGERQAQADQARTARHRRGRLRPERRPPRRAAARR